MYKLTVEDYSDLSLPNRIKVDKWLSKYDLETVHTVEMTDDDGIICYGPNVYPYYSATVPMEPRAEPDSSIIVAVFEFCDFPWEVLD